MLDAYQRWQFTAIAITIDKKAHLALYGEWHRSPYVYCLQVLMERYILLLKSRKVHGDAMIEARAKREDTELALAYSKFFLAGSGYVSPDTWQEHLTTKQIKINPKQDNITGLQLADLLGHAAITMYYTHTVLYQSKKQNMGGKSQKFCEIENITALVRAKLWGLG